MLPVLLLLALTRPGETAAGRVVRVAGADTAAAAGALVVLHRVGANAQGAIDSVRADAAGRFAFRFTADSGTAYLVSARWAGIEYFAAPLLAGRDDRAITIAVADTSSSAPVTVSARHVVVSGPAADGTRTVVDLVILANAGPRTRVPGGDDLPTWQLVLPRYAVNVRVADSDFAATAFGQHDDTLMLYAPIPPGERQVFIEYQLAPGTRDLVVPVAAGVATVNLMTEEAVRVRGMSAQADTSVNDRRFHRWTASFASGGEMSAVFGRTSVPGWLVPAVGATLVAMLLALTIVGMRRRAPAPLPTGERDQLIDAIARLDADYRGGAAAFAPEQWDAYLTQRAELKQRLIRMMVP